MSTAVAGHWTNRATLPTVNVPEATGQWLTAHRLRVICHRHNGFIPTGTEYRIDWSQGMPRRVCRACCLLTAALASS